MASFGIDWDKEIHGLQDLTCTVARSHQIAVEALWNRFALASDALEQKIITAKMIAEETAALEEVGAIAWSVGNRSGYGVLRRYLSYEVRNVHEFYERIDAGENLRALLSLPGPDALALLTDDDHDAFERGQGELDKVLRICARKYRALDGQAVKTYNKIKHGFPVIVRLNLLAGGAEPPTNWEQAVNVLTGIKQDGSIHYTAIERSEGMLDNIVNVVSMCSSVWKELAGVLVFLWERKVSLE